MVREMEVRIRHKKNNLVTCNPRQDLLYHGFLGILVGLLMDMTKFLEIIIKRTLRR